jgi:hypothetical protein
MRGHLNHGGHPRAKQKPVFLIDIASNVVSLPPPTAVVSCHLAV